MEVLAPVFGTQKRGSNTGRVGSCIISQNIYGSTYRLALACGCNTRSLICDLPPGRLCLSSSKTEGYYGFRRLAVSAFQAGGDWEQLL